jgi:Tfp pilus assembly protein PilO
MNRRTLLIGIGGALGVILVWYFLLWSPQGNAIAKAKGRQAAAESQSQELRARLSRLREAQRNEAATRAQIEEVRQAIPDEPNLAQFILDANDAAARSGIDFLSIAPTPPAAPAAAAAPADGTAGRPGQPSQITMSLSLTGGYFQILDFMNRINALTRVVVLDSLSIAGGTMGDLTVQLSGRMFTTKGAAAAPGAAGGSTTTTVAGSASTTTTRAGG